MQLVERATQTRKDGSKFILETTNIPSPSVTSKLIFPNPMDIRMQFHTPLVFSPGEAGKCATFRPTDKEKRIHGDGRDAKTGAVVAAARDYARVLLGPEAARELFRPQLLDAEQPRPADSAGRGAGCQGGADGLWRWMRALGNLGWVDCIGGAGFYGSQILPVGDETTLKLYSNSKREFLTW
ncbi:hypothetical protein M0657_010923 [Pyricularia oryzae]|nr:hypothetical protein M0657_010923 [Pyricularia oryzae]KAI7914450.1 hypothetical protein M9X92_008985 [Pyricularia oryzae]